MEATKRGEKDREREKEVMEGEPTEARRENDPAAQAVTTTRDQGATAAKDSSHGDKKS